MLRRFHAPPSNFRGDTAWLDPGEAKHLRDVLRLGVGDAVSVFDGEGREFHAVVTSIQRSSATLEIVEETAPAAPESDLELTLAVGLLKGEKFDLVVQKAVELGASTLAPLQTIRTDVKLRDPSGRLERWRRIALEATKQCGRAKLMTISAPSEFGRFVREFRAGSAESALMFSERGGVVFSASEDRKKITAVVGPEGGWEDSEIELARACGFEVITLGGRILRAETAAISITAILQNRFGDLA